MPGGLRGVLKRSAVLWLFYTDGFPKPFKKIQITSWQKVCLSVRLLSNLLLLTYQVNYFELNSQARWCEEKKTRVNDRNMFRNVVLWVVKAFFKHSKHLQGSSRECVRHTLLTQKGKRPLFMPNAHWGRCGRRPGISENSGPSFLYLEKHATFETYFLLHFIMLGAIFHYNWESKG